MPNPYSIPLNPEAELGIIIQIEAGKRKQGHATFVMLQLLEKYKDEFIEKWGQELYDQLHAKYSLTVSEQKAVKQEKRERAKKLKEEHEKLEEIEEIPENCPICGSHLHLYDDRDRPDLIRYCGRCKRKFTKTQLMEPKNGGENQK